MLNLLRTGRTQSLNHWRLNSPPVPLTCNFLAKLHARPEAPDAFWAYRVDQGDSGDVTGMENVIACLKFQFPYSILQGERSFHCRIASVAHAVLLSE